MSLDPSRRAFIAAAGAVAASAVISARAAAGNAIDYRTAGDLLRALANHRISSRELVDAASALASAKRRGCENGAVHWAFLASSQQPVRRTAN